MYQILYKSISTSTENVLVDRKLNEAVNDEERVKVFRDIVSKHPEWKSARLAKKVIYYDDIDIYERY